MNLENAINKDGFYDRSQPGLLSQFTQAIYALRTIGWVYSRYDPENVCINFDANDAPPKFLIKDFKRAILLKPAKSTGNHEESFLEFVNHKTMRQIEITNNILMQKLASFSEDIRNQHAQYYGLNQNTIKEVQTELGHNTPNASGQANRRPEQLPNYHMDDSEPPLYISDRLPEYQDRN
ncbi:hypothetical protein BDF19DRAFT_415444 [Syncephalis fuscata]|nr:hypothetical protein BDF19DRAFT_415444 [Syncephalis fuscata]